MIQQNEYSMTYVLTAGETDAEGRMPLTLITERVIEISTMHADFLGIGYSTLKRLGLGWVLSRVSIEMFDYPEINGNYTMTTWIESYNRHFSERNVVMTDASGRVLGYMRTVWAAMNIEKRSCADLSAALGRPFPTADLPCPIAKAPRIGSLSENAECDRYTFRYRDLDFNRHVNTVRYLDLILNHWSLDFFDTHVPARFDIMFHHECHYGETVELRVDSSADGLTSECEIVRDGNTRCIAASVRWKKV
ncbi:MAG: hypothetical protein K2F63_03625 [Muribaculaceae bacterium]|nr:hypothetical protein [Muribaculaceae bacterium]MDE6135595.1 hypothetical protein [Muribaculaceae bacterium]